MDFLALPLLLPGSLLQMGRQIILTCVPQFQPLVADTWYEVSFYINLANPHCGINKFGAYFSYIQPYLNNFHPLNFDPQVEANQGFLNDTVGWELVIGCFQAQGGEQYITLGNFYTDAETQVESGCGTGIAYLLIENVTVVETTEPEIIPLYGRMVVQGLRWKWMRQGPIPSPSRMAVITE